MDVLSLRCAFRPTRFRIWLHNFDTKTNVVQRTRNLPSELSINDFLLSVSCSG